jgi:hypothetical protein
MNNPMPYHEQVDAFANELESLVERFRDEWDLTLETMIGCIEVQKTLLSQPVIMDMGCELLEEDEEEEEDGIQ